MANVTISPNMMLPVPTVSVDPSPDWANNINSSLSIIDGHNHATGSGVQINPDGININADLSFNNVNNLIQVRSVRFYPNVANLSGANDLGCIYEAGVDLWYNDGNGNQVRITQSGSLAGAAGTITGLPSGTASASYSSASGTFVFQQATSTAANIDVGTVIVRYPGSYPTPAGNYIALEAPSSLSSGYALTLPVIPGVQSFVTIDTSGVLAGYASINGGITGTNIATNVALQGTGVTVAGKTVIVSQTSDAPLGVIRGYCNGSASGSGTGFSWTSSGTGVYNITFNTAFGDTPSVTTAVSNTAVSGSEFFVATIGVISSSGVTIVIGKVSTLSLVSCDFYFNAIGMV